MSTSHVIYTGAHSLDVTPVEGKLLDLEAGGTRGHRPDLAGFQNVVLTLEQSYPTSGKAAGIPEDAYNHFLMCNSMVDTIDEKLVVGRKLVEVLEESRSFYVDARQNDIAIMVDAMKSRAQRRKDESILTPFESVIAYHGQTGEKAAKTRKLNATKAKELAEAAAQAENGTAEKASIDAYKAELEAKFNESVALAVEKKLAEMKLAPQVA